MNNENTCFIWGTPAIETHGVPGRFAAICNSPRAGGRYWIGDRSIHFLKDPRVDWIDERLKARLTTWLIEQREAGKECPKVRDFILNEMQTRPPSTMKQRARNLLTYISNSLTDVADNFFFDHRDRQTWEMLAWSESTNHVQLANVIRFLVESEFLDVVSRDTYRFTADGHEQIARGKGNVGLDELPTEIHTLMGETEGKTQFLQKTLGEITQSLLTEDQRGGLILALAAIRNELAKKYAHPEKVAYQTGFIQGVLGAYKILHNASSSSPSEPETPA